MFDIEKYYRKELSMGNSVAIIPAGGIFSHSNVDTIIEQDNVKFVPQNSIIGLQTILSCVDDEPESDSDPIIDLGNDQDSFIQFSGENRSKYLTQLTGIDLVTFETSDLAIFSFDTEDYLRCEGYNDEVALLIKLSDRAFDALNVVRYLHCNLYIPDLLPFSPGHWDKLSSFFGACILTPHSLPRLVAGKRTGGMASSGLGMGLEADDVERMCYNSAYKQHIKKDTHTGEVGRMISRSLKLYSRAMYTNNETLKFVFTIALFEYLASGDKYNKFKEDRKKLQVHIARNKAEYDKLSETFMKLTSLRIDGVQLGYRTRIIHQGALIEDLVPLEAERRKLFEGLTDYIQKIIRGMYPFSSKSFVELQKHRTKLLNDLLGL